MINKSYIYIYWNKVGLDHVSAMVKRCLGLTFRIGYLVFLEFFLYFWGIDNRIFFYPRITVDFES
jgi:hypothetical protein